VYSARCSAVIGMAARSSAADGVRSNSFGVLWGLLLYR
jgi:hypothetical protein